MSEAHLLRLRVAAIESLTDRISRFFLVPDAAGSALPPAQPGSHIVLVLPTEGGAAIHRAYSVVDSEVSAQHYEIAVQREEQGTGGSIRMHQLQVGNVVAALAPVNDFALAAAQGRSILIAGGIGITPILSMATHLAAQGRAFRLEYLTRDRRSTAYAQAAEALGCSRLWHDEGAVANGPPLTTLIGGRGVGDHLYVCGPKGLIAAVTEAARGLGWPAEAVHYELFAGALEQRGDRTFRLGVEGSDTFWDVRPEQTILDVLEQAGMPVLSDCRRGECGVCMTAVVRGIPDHRDSTLTAAEREAGRLICPCVSRSTSDEIVLQLSA
jgi:vanillate O-demethylase ferredoxin subunit